MAILLLADHDTSHLSDQTAKALTAATKIASGTIVLKKSGLKPVE
jgi:electron transfer flavoprotein alpha subunit